MHRSQKDACHRFMVAYPELRGGGAPNAKYKQKIPASPLAPRPSPYMIHPQPPPPPPYLHKKCTWRLWKGLPITAHTPSTEVLAHMSSYIHARGIIALQTLYCNEQ